MGERTRIISRKQMAGDSKYSYCPFCIQEHKEDYAKTLRPLFVVYTGTYVGDGYKEYVDRHYECPNCQNRNITVADFEKVYCC